MHKILKILTFRPKLFTHLNVYPNNVRTFLSQAYYCNEVWEHRLNNPVIQKVNLQDFYFQLDQSYNKTKNISAVDVDIFANAVKDNAYTDELLDLIHKLRLSADTSNTLSSTPHAVVRNLVSFDGLEQLLNILDDRINYGIFLDHYTANLLLDTCWKKRDFVSGARVAAQLMLQEDLEHVLSSRLSLLHCYNFLLNPTGWPTVMLPEEPEEEVKVRVKYLRNPYYDDHFDLKDPLKIVGKTIVSITKTLDNKLDKSLHIVGLALWDKRENASKLIEKMVSQNEDTYEEVIKLLPEEDSTRKELSKIPINSDNVSEQLEDRVRQAERLLAEKDVAFQCETYTKWEQERIEALEKQQQRLLTAKRLAEIEISQKLLKEKETKLWFFDNEEKIELEIEAKKELVKDEKTEEIKAKEVDEEYIPPEIKRTYVR